MKLSIESDRIVITSTGGLNTIKNPEDFFGGYSKPINRELMRIYKDIELVEQLGSGLDRILNYYKKDSFVIAENFLQNVFISDCSAIQNEGVKNLYNLIQKNPNSKTPQLAKHLNRSPKTTERWLKQLKDEDKIEFKGSFKTGEYFARQETNKGQK